MEENKVNSFSIYRLTFEDGTNVEKQFTGYLMFQSNENEVKHKILKAELIKEWEEEVVSSVIEADLVEEVDSELEEVEKDLVE